jgi:ABC-type branched-subunit amino acid transport system ATPase component/branched-subunit amino acid ABC-type transport system permease component
MSAVWQFVLLGVGVSAGYVLAAQGAVVVFRGSGVVNFAQGAFALVGAFADWGLQNAGFSPVPALLLGVLVAALAGGLTYALVMRWLTHASQLVQVIATLGVSLTITEALTLYYGTTARSPSRILSTRSVYLLGAHISQYDLVLFPIAVAFTAGLWGLYKFTRFGMATTAVSENARAAAALGHRPELVGLINWTLGGALGGLAGILIAPDIGLTTTTIGFLLIPALAAAVLGRFTSFWLTLAGGLIVAIGSSLLTRYSVGAGWSDAFPFLVIIAILLFRSSSLPGRGESTERLPSVGTGRVRWPLVVAGLVAGALLIAVLPAGGEDAVTISLTASIIALSLTVVTGYAGQISLAQFGLAGVSAFTAAKVSADWGFSFWAALIAGVLVALPVGAIVGLPALRARGVNLAIATLGLGLTIEDVLLSDPSLQNQGAGLAVKPPSLFGYDMSAFAHPGRYATLCLILFAACALMVANLRRGRVGRELIALRANERAAAALGINLTLAKLYAFVVGAGLAGLAGVLIAFQQPFVVFLPSGGGPPFDPTTGITLLSLVIVCGIGYAGASIVAGLGFGVGIAAWIVGLVFSSQSAAGWLALFGGVGVVLTVLWLPNGLAASPAALLGPFALLGKRLWPMVEASLDRIDPKRPVPTAAADVSPPARGACTLEAHGLRVRFGGVVALDDVSVTVASGEIVGLIGPNGAGKSTLIDAISGHNRRYQGRILLDGKPVDSASATKRARLGIGRSFQALELFDDLTVEDNVRAGSELPAVSNYFTDLVAPRRRALSPNARAAVAEFDLGADLERMPSELPFGRRRLVGIARTVAASPRILLLDEPAAGLDDHECDELAGLLTRLAHDRGLGILLVEHNVNLVLGVSDRVIALDFGQVIAQGAAEDVRHDPAVVSAYLGGPPGDAPARPASPRQPASRADENPAHPAQTKAVSG